MTDTLPLETPPQVIRSHKVSTLPALLSALQDLVAHARKIGVNGPIDLADFTQFGGVTVSLMQVDPNFLTIKMSRKRPESH